MFEACSHLNRTGEISLKLHKIKCRAKIWSNCVKLKSTKISSEGEACILLAHNVKSVKTGTKPAPKKYVCCPFGEKRFEDK